jgi:non-ribosomal peptide synthetase component F
MVSVDGEPHAAPVPRARTLLDLVRETVVKWPDRLAIDADDAQLTHAELFDAARALAGRLRRRGIGPGDRVGVHLPSDSVDLYVAILGVLHAGAAYVPVDAGDPPTRTAEIWERAAVVAVVESRLAMRELRPPAANGRTAGPDDEAWVTFAAGSMPRTGVAVSHRAVVTFIETRAAAERLGAQDRALAALPQGFDASHAEMWLAWRAGAVLVPVPRSLARGGTERRRWLAERRVNVELESLASPCGALLQSDTLPKTSRRRR